ncbi:uncharacterized protein LOC117503486 [Thalassophryne amazonica]|uniref:uncharacterized protein LOC117503486 n=1 Tax=Thalassophryne amazonica TaxID=390379 RepID=UPI001470A461|nr:uncharacterized protein LOC117503486 [Thalassophryne amazonica]
MKSEDVFVPLEDVKPVVEPATAHAAVRAWNPWPHLEDFFVFKSVDKSNNKLMFFRCALCQPKQTTIKAHISSLYNLKSHVRRNHSAQITRFEERIKAGSSRGKRREYPGSSLQPFAMNTCQLSQPTIGEAFGQSAAGVHQSVVDAKIVDLFVCNMLPLHVVESPSFIRLIKTLDPSKTSMSSRTLGRRISASHKQLEEHLIRLLKDVPWVATTADCWSAHNRSYLGMTAHWLDPKTRTRQCAVLACSQLRGHPTFDVLVEAMVDIHYKFHLQDKVTRTTTDNSINFVKAFVQFSTEAELFPDIPEPAADFDMDVKDVDMDMDAKAEAMNEVEHISVESALEVCSGLGHDLPVHMRCAAHTFNLVASVDAEKALASAPFKLAYRKAMSKAQALWNQQCRSTVSADSILDGLNRRLVVPNDTRWNSTYDSVVVLNNLLQNKRGAVHRVMTQLKLQNFTDSEVCFLKEYAQVMSNVAKALDKVQGEDQAYLGSLLPTVAATIMKLKEVKSKGLLYCSPLVDAILAGIMKRFGPLFEDEECQLAAAFHPRFRLFWLEKHNHSQFSRVKKAMETAVETALREIIVEGSGATSSDEDDEDDFFSSITQPQECRSHRSVKTKAQNLVKTWLEASSKEVLTDIAFLGEQVLVDMFIKYNTAIPSSAVVGHLFSIDKNILRAGRATLSDDASFERLVFIQGNKHHLDEMELQEGKSE